MAAADESVRLMTDISLHEYTLGEWRLVLVGKTGNGKSTLANKILGREDVLAPFPTPEGADPQASPVQCSEHIDQDSSEGADCFERGFEVSPWFVSCTKTCQYREGTVEGKELKVIDTPGLYDTNEKVEASLIELTRCMSIGAPGPHAVLFVVRLDAKFTPEEDKAFKKIIKMFGKDVKDYVIIAFTHGEIVKTHNVDFERLVGQVPSLQAVLKEVHDRYVIFSNDPTKKTEEVRALLQKIAQIGEQKLYPHFTNDTLKKQAEIIEKKAEKLREKEPSMTKADALQEVRRQIARSNQTKKFFLKLILTTAGSTAFLTLAGLTGGLALGASPFIVAGLAEGAALGTIVGGAGGALGSFSAAVAKVVSFFKERQKTEASGENKTCVIS